MDQYNGVVLDFEKQGIIEKVRLEKIAQALCKMHCFAHITIIRNKKETTEPSRHLPAQS